MAEPAVAAAVAASNAEVAAILAEDIGAFGDSLALDVVFNSPRGTINRRDDTLAAFAGGFIRYGAFDRRTWSMASCTPPGDGRKD